MSVNPQASRSLRSFGRQLQELRERANPRVTQKAVGEAIGKSRDLVSFMERGGQWPTAAQLKIMLDLYGVDDLTRAAVTAHMQAAQEVDDVWWTAFPDLPRSLVRLIELEDVAAKVWIYASGAIPGLLQTKEYVEALFRFETIEFGKAHITPMTTVRVCRGDVLTRPHPMSLDCVIAEGVLREHTGGREVMAAQLRHLLEMGRRANVTVRVIPKEAPVAAGSFATFSLYDFPNEPTIRTADIVDGISYSEDSKLVGYSRRVYDYMTEFASNHDASMNLIEDILKELEQHG